MPQYFRSAWSICWASIWVAGRELTRYSVSTSWAGLRELSTQRVSRAACSANGKAIRVAAVSKAIRQRASVRLRLSSQVWSRDVCSRGGKCACQMGIELLRVGGDAGLIAFDGEQIITAFFLYHNARGLGLGVERVGGDQ